MIHQLIFARPKPGMSEPDFQDYWLKVHAVRYASKIPQIRRYLIGTRIDAGVPEPDPLFSGVAEIWLSNEEEQLASLQSKEFLEGARVDEPRWAAFWATLGLDTTGHVLLEGPPLQRQPSGIKLYLLLKRREGIPLQAFRRYLLEVHGPLGLQLPGLRRYLQCHVRDGFCAVGEARFDAVEQLWFDDVEALTRMRKSSQYREAFEPDSKLIAEDRYRLAMAVREHWIIGPDAR